MKWSARINSKSEVDLSGNLTYTFTVLRDGEESVTGEVSGAPSDIQQLIEDKVKYFAQAFELAEDLPCVGDELEIIVDVK